MRNMGKSIAQLLSFILMFFVVVFSSWAEGVTFNWDKNTENDLAGYRLYQSDTPGGQVIGGESSPNFVKAILPNGTDIEETTITITPTSDITLYWIVTAYDVGDLESGKSNEVSKYFNVSAPVPPGNLEKVDVQTANVYINGDIKIIEANVQTLRVVKEN